MRETLLQAIPCVCFLIQEARSVTGFVHWSNIVSGCYISIWGKVIPGDFADCFLGPLPGNLLLEWLVAAGKYIIIRSFPIFREKVLL